MSVPINQYLCFYKVTSDLNSFSNHVISRIFFRSFVQISCTYAKKLWKNVYDESRNLSITVLQLRFNTIQKNVTTHATSSIFLNFHLTSWLALLYFSSMYGNSVTVKKSILLFSAKKNCFYRTKLYFKWNETSVPPPVCLKAFLKSCKNCDLSAFR